MHVDRLKQGVPPEAGELDVEKDISRISMRHFESDAINRALAMVIKAQSDLPIAHFWRTG